MKVSTAPLQGQQSFSRHRCPDSERYDQWTLCLDICRQYFKLTIAQFPNSQHDNRNKTQTNGDITYMQISTEKLNRTRGIAN